MPLKQAFIEQAFLRTIKTTALTIKHLNRCSDPNYCHAHESLIFVLISLSAKVEILRVSFPHTIKQMVITL